MGCNCECKRKKYKCTKKCIRLCKPRNLSEPHGITSHTFTTSGDITGTIPETPIIPATLTYLAKGNPEDPIAICVHGYPSSATEWRYLMDDLSKKGYYAVAPYIRGYAPTTNNGPVPPAEIGLFYALQDVVDLLLGLGALDSTRFGKNVYIGSDWGSIIGQFIVNDTGLPGFKKFVGINIPPEDMFGQFLSGKYANYEQVQRVFYFYWFNIAPEMGKFAQNLALDDNTETGTSNFRAINMVEKQWKQWSPSAYPPQQNVDIQFAKQALSDDTNLEIAISYYKSLFTGPPTVFPRVSVPTLWMFGENDGLLLWKSKLTSKQFEEEVLSRSSGGSEVYISKCGGHFLNLDDTEPVNKRILEFIQ